MQNQIRQKKRFLLSLVSLLLALTASGCATALAAAYVTTTTVTSLNSAPVAENLSVDTYRGVAVSETLRSLDPEGDPVTYSVTKKPKKGSVQLNGAVFTYTPADGKKGKDTFTYAAIDSAGNISNHAVVTVNIKKQSTDVMYSDMVDNDAWYAATELAERGIFVGERLGSSYLFNPHEPVSRGEFLAMCVDVAGGEVVGNITRTGFTDDEAIPDWQKPYVTTAVMLDIVNGRVTAEGKIVFAPDDAITFAEASVILNNTLSITDVSCENAPENCPVWAEQAVANLTSCRILSEGDAVSPAAVTREDAAKMLLGALQVMDSRKKSGGLLSWAR